MTDDATASVTFRDRERIASTDARAAALDCLAAGIEASLPERLLPSSVTVHAESDTLRVEGVDGAVGEYDLAAYDRVFLLGAGKAAAGAAAALVDALDGHAAIEAGAVVTDDPEAKSSPTGVEVLAGDHPLPSDRGAESARRVLDLAARAGPDDLVFTVITGGGSALLAAPADPLSTEDLRALTDALLACGASIDEINAVRKHCSAVKGGRLARAAAPATVVTLAVSDVIGDPLDVIASGPTVPDPSTYADAMDVLDRYDLDVPAAVREHLRSGAEQADQTNSGAEQADQTDSDADRADQTDSDAIDGPVETPAATDPAFDRARAFIIGNGRTALDAAADAAAERGYEPLVLAAGVRGEAREAALTHAAIAEECAARGSPVSPPAVLLSGGETTVTLDGAAGSDDPDTEGSESDAPGSGGPNAEFAASAGLGLATGELGDGASDPDRVVVASADTDGIDGPTDAAGAIADATTLAPGDARDALDRHDVYPALDEANALLRTGPTGTNVNDLRVIVVEEGADG